MNTHLTTQFLVLCLVGSLAAVLAAESAPESDEDTSGVQVASAHGELVEGTAIFSPAEAVPFELPDQFKQVHSLDFPQDRPVLLGIGDRHGAHQVLRWYHPIHKAYGEQLRYVAVGALHTLPQFLAPVIRHFLRKDVDKPIFLDWDGAIVQAYEYEKKISNLFVIDRDGKILLRIDGPRTEDGLAQVKTVLDKLLEPKAEPEAEPANEDYFPPTD
jgi:hypothetical protein